MSQACHRRDSTRASFTLVELLVVITIIIILAGLISVAAVLAISTAKQTRICNEIQEMDIALKKMASDYSAETIPDFTYSNSGNNPVDEWFQHAFPRSQDTISSGLGNSGTGQPTTDQLVYLFLMGFSVDPAHPFTGDGGPCSNTWGKYKRFDFDQNRLKNPVQVRNFWMFNSGTFPNTPTTNVVYSYIPLDTLQAPYCLFSSIAYQVNSSTTPVTKSYTGIGLASFPPPWSTTVNQFSGIARPYFTQYDAASSTSKFCNPSTFQIISAGLDDDYGGAPVTSPLLFPGGANYTDGDRDNLTNFCQGTLGAAIP